MAEIQVLCGQGAEDLETIMHLLQGMGTALSERF